MIEMNSNFYIVARRRTQRSAKGAQRNFPKRKEVNGADASRIRWRHIVDVNATIEFRCPRATEHILN